MKVLGFVGSLRKGSYNRMLYTEFVKGLPAGVEVEEGLFADWPIFNEDTEVPTPAAVLALKEKIAAADGIFFVTPEYNRTIPGGLKNMLDWTSRDPFPWPGKKTFVLGTSSGERGANMAQYDLKRVLIYFGCRLLGQPEVYVSNNKDKFDQAGALTDERTKQHVAKAAAAFGDFLRS